MAASGMRGDSRTSSSSTVTDGSALARWLDQMPQFVRDDRHRDSHRRRSEPDGRCTGLRRREAGPFSQSEFSELSLRRA
jgi:hypothetical protein